MTLGVSPIVAHPEKQGRLSCAYEECVTHGGVEKAVQAVVGWGKYNIGTWESVVAAFNANQVVALQAFRNIDCSASRTIKENACDIDDVRMVVLKGPRGQPRKEAPAMHGPFGTQRCYRSQVAAHVFEDAAGMVWIHSFANQSLSPSIEAAQRDARESGWTYLIELDKETRCIQNSGQAPSWESSVVLLVLRTRGPLVLTMNAIPSEQSDRLGFSFTSMGGNELAVLSVDSATSRDDLCARLASQLDIPKACVKLVLPNGKCAGRKPCERKPKGFNLA